MIQNNRSPPLYFINTRILLWLLYRRLNGLLCSIRERIVSDVTRIRGRGVVNYEYYTIYIQTVILILINTNTYTVITLCLICDQWITIINYKIKSECRF